MAKSDKTVSIQRVSTLEEFSALGERWNALLADSPADNFFLRWEWLWSWWKTCKEDSCELCILLATRGDELVGIAPFCVTSRLWERVVPVRRLMFLGTRQGSVVSEYMDIIYKAGEEGVVEKMMEFVVTENLCDELSLQKIGASSKTMPLLKQISKDRKFLYIVQEKAQTPYVSLPSTYDDFMGALGASMRHKIKRNRKRLMNYPEVVFRRTEDVSEFEEDFGEFVRLHQLRWESRNMPGSFSEDRFFNFQKLTMREMLKKGNLELWFLSISGKNIAALYNIRYGDKIYFFQAGLDTSFDPKLAPGLLLHDYCLENAIKAGLKEYDFLLRGSLDDWKTRWASEYRWMYDIYMAPPGKIKWLMFLREKVRAYLHKGNQ